MHAAAQQSVQSNSNNNAGTAENGSGNSSVVKLETPNPRSTLTAAFTAMVNDLAAHNVKPEPGNKEAKSGAGTTGETQVNSNLL